MSNDPLLQPFQLKHLTLRNRIMTTSHEPAYGDDGMPKDRYRLYPLERQKAGDARVNTAASASVRRGPRPPPHGRGRVAAAEILKSNPRTREYIEKGETEGKSLLDAIRDGEIDGMQDFDTVIRGLIEKKVITMEDGLSFATNQNNLLLQLKGLSSTEEYANAGMRPMPKPMIPPPPPENPDSVLNMME